MNNQAQRKKEALKHRASVNAALEQFGLTLNDPPVSVGILLDRIDISQLAFFAIKNINKFHDLDTQIDLSIYVKTPTPACIQPLYPVFDFMKINQHIDSIIATSFSSLIDAASTRTKTILYYAFEIDFLDHAYDNMRIYDNRIVCVSRSQKYADILKTRFNIDVLEVVANFELNKLLPIIMRQIKGDQSGQKKQIN